MNINSADLNIPPSNVGSIGRHSHSVTVSRKLDLFTRYQASNNIENLIPFFDLLNT